MFLEPTVTNEVIMNRKILLQLAAALLACAALAGPAVAAPATSDGLVATSSRNLDEIYVRPNANLANYRRVVVDPGQASLASDWLKSMNQQRTPGRWVTREDAQRLQDEAASSLAPIVSEAFRAQGYELVTAPGPGVLRISPRVSDLYVNAPDTYDSGIQRYVVRDAGQATLHLEVRDAATGEVVARVIDRSTAKEINRNFNRATNVTNQFWLEAMYRQWASNVAKELVSAQVRP